MAPTHCKRGVFPGAPNKTDDFQRSCICPEQPQHVRPVVPDVQPVWQIPQRVLTLDGVAVPRGRGLRRRERVEGGPVNKLPRLALEYKEPERTVLVLDVLQKPVLAHDRQYVIANGQSPGLPISRIFQGQRTPRSVARLCSEPNGDLLKAEAYPSASSISSGSRGASPHPNATTVSLTSDTGVPPAMSRSSRRSSVRVRCRRSPRGVPANHRIYCSPNLSIQLEILSSPIERSADGELVMTYIYGKDVLRPAAILTSVRPPLPPAKQRTIFTQRPVVRRK